MKPYSENQFFSRHFFTYSVSKQAIISKLSKKTYLGYRLLTLFSILLICITNSKAQLPSNVLVGYHANWGSLRLSQCHTNYNVICLAFGLPTAGTDYDIRYTLPAAYGGNAALFMSDIDALHAAGKVVLLSLGGAFDPVYINSVAERNIFTSSINTIFATYGYKIDGIDFDGETTSMHFPVGWTVTSPVAQQQYLIDGIKNVMTNYSANTGGKKMLLTMAPETYYIQGGMSSGPYTGSFLPVVHGLRNELDLLHVQLYNTGSMYDWQMVERFPGNGDFLTSMTETLIQGFTLSGGRGTFTGLPASKLAFGVPSTSSAGSNYVTPTVICQALRYFRGEITKPAGWTYNMVAAHPTLRGVMTWSIDDDNPSWAFATGVKSCTVPITAPVTLTHFDGKRSGNSVALKWTTVSEVNNDYFNVERSSDGISFSEIVKIDGLGNSEVGTTYYHTDANAGQATVYYRLAQYDFDGSRHYSPVIVVNAAGSSGLSIQNNPFTESLEVFPFSAGNEQTAFVHITDQSGKLLETKELPLNETANIGESLTPGFYVVQFEYNGSVERYKVIKQ